MVAAERCLLFWGDLVETPEMSSMFACSDSLAGGGTVVMAFPPGSMVAFQNDRERSSGF